MFQDGLFTFLTTQPSLVTILGATRKDNTTGVFPVLAIGTPTLPYIAYQRVSGRPSHTLSGQNQWTDSRWRFSIYASSQKGAQLLAAAMKTIFKSYTGTFPDGTQVQNVVLELEADDAESLPRGTIFAEHVDYTFQYVDSTL